jgi:hypothetical protein
MMNPEVDIACLVPIVGWLQWTRADETRKNVIGLSTTGMESGIQSGTQTRARWNRISILSVKKYPEAVAPSDLVS